MTPEELTAARKLAAAPGWAFSPGMAWRLGPWGGRVTESEDGDEFGLPAVVNRTVEHVPPDAHPDLSDGPTKGALLERVRERWGAPFAIAQNMEGYDGEFGWVVTVPLVGHWSHWPRGDTEGLALAAAWHAAPVQP